jgi:hypothetical protein
VGLAITIAISTISAEITEPESPKSWPEMPEFASFCPEKPG